ncbi:MAG: DEAD/DEAH box helicase, partial [Chloroflexota bacterium]|nr:DEAD/DEAH box helicase [Chloroflexota bacterium]
IAPRDYQRDAIAAIFAAQERGLRRILLTLPTGAGKTVVFSLVIEQMLARGGRVLVLVHRDELLQQAVTKLRDVPGPDADIGIVKAEHDEPTAQIVVASVQTLVHERRLRRLGEGFTLIVIDEAHHAAAPTYRRILDHFGALDSQNTGAPFVLGVTATVDRGDGIGLDSTFQEIVYELGMLDLIRQGHLVDLKAVQVAVAADFNNLHTRAGDIIDSDAARVLMDADAPSHVARAYREHAADRTGLIFTPTIDVAHAMAEALRGKGFPAAALDGTTPSDTRRRILRGLRDGDIQAVTNCAVLTEGFDEPKVDCITIARPTKSRSLYTQMIGRGTRPYPGKTGDLIIDVVGATTRHDLMTAPELFGLPASSLKTKTVAAAIAERDAPPIPTAAGGQLVSATVDLFRQRPANWIPTGTGRAVLPLGDGTLVLRPQFGDRWDVLHVPREGTPMVLSAGLTLGYAQGFAEDYARRLGAHALVSRGAPWRTAPPTDKQLYRLKLLGVPLKTIRTRGEASDAITAALAGEVA